MATLLQTPKASHQNLSSVSLGGRAPFAGPDYQRALRSIENEAIKARGATTQAAYLLRLNTLRSLLKSL